MLIKLYDTLVIGIGPVVGGIVGGVLGALPVAIILIVILVVLVVITLRQWRKQAGQGDRVTCMHNVCMTSHAGN